MSNTNQMQSNDQYSISHSASPVRWRGWLIVASALLSAHFLSAWYYAAAYEQGGVTYRSATLTLDMTPDQWCRILDGRDAAYYLRAGQNIAAGRGVVIGDPASATPHYVPFTYWGPEAPAAIGVWLKIFGGRTMWSIFFLSADCSSFSEFLRLPLPRFGFAVRWRSCDRASTGICPPLQNWFYRENLTSSEIVSLVPLALFVFVFARAMIAYRRAEGTFWASPGNGAWRSGLLWPGCLWG